MVRLLTVVQVLEGSDLSLLSEARANLNDLKRDLVDTPEGGVLFFS